MADSPRDEDNFLSQQSGSLNGDSSFSLAQHYIPDKITLFPTGWGAEARKASRVAAGGWGAAAGPKRHSTDSKASSTTTPSKYKGNGVLFKPEIYRESSGFSSSIYSPYSTQSVDPFTSITNEIGPPSSGHRNRKWGAGREAWGRDGGGNPALGAGDFEDDDGLDLSQDRSLPRLSTPNEEHGDSTANNSTSALLQGQTSLLPRLLGAQVPQNSKRARWNRFKWCLVAMNTLVSDFFLAAATSLPLANDLLSSVTAHNILACWLCRSTAGVVQHVSGDSGARLGKQVRDDLGVVLLFEKKEKEYTC